MAKIIPNMGQSGTKRSWHGIVRTVVLTLALVFVAGAAGAGVRWVVDRPTKAVPFAKLPKAVDDVQELRLEGNPEAADAMIAEELKNSSLDSGLRYDLLIQQGHSLVEKKDYQAAIEAYLAAEKLKATRAIAWVLADTYVKLDDKTQAIAYYKKAIERVPADDPLAAADTEYLQHRVQALEAE